MKHILCSLAGSLIFLGIALAVAQWVELPWWGALLFGAIAVLLGWGAGGLYAALRIIYDWQIDEGGSNGVIEEKQP